MTNIDLSSAQLGGAFDRPVAERWYSDRRVAGLVRFALAITVLNLLGHFWLGFEQSWITPFVALAAAYSTELALETVAAREERRPARYLGEGGIALVKFLLSAHITALAVGMLLFAAEQLWVVAFAASLAVATKWLVRVRIGGVSRHVLNPSNFGITAALLLFPSVGIAPPYMFTEALTGAGDWLLPLVIICLGSLLNTKFTGRIPLILAWLGAFVAQALIRAVLNGTPLLAGLVPMTGFAFILFTFYMITDPATSPARRGGQIAFAIAVAAFYGIFMQFHVVFGLFYALTLVTIARGLWFVAQERVFVASTAPTAANLPPVSTAETARP
jgi:Na+-translocating ferredoxin:NAD+ oxidoreductase RnfD subunit